MQREEIIISFKSPIEKYNHLPDAYKGMVMDKANNMIASHYEEKQLLSIFSQLSERNKGRLLERAKILLEEQLKEDISS